MENTVRKYIKELHGDVALIIRDNKEGNKIAINSKEIFPSASIIKLFILLVLNKKDYDKIIEIKKEDQIGGFGILKKIHPGLKMTIKDLAYFMICLSDNTATNILIDYIGMEIINLSLLSKGFQKTRLGRKMMDTKAIENGFDNYTTAEETLKVIEKLCEDKDTLDILKSQMCNNKIPLYFSRKKEFAHKTGDLKGIEHDAGRIFFDDRSIDVVVLTKNLIENSEGIVFNNKIGDLLYKNYK